MNVLTKSRDVAVYPAGGRYNQQNDSFHDEQTVACLANFHSEVFFLSPDGIDTTSITTDYNTENFVKNEMIKNADKVFAIADYTKIGKRCLKKICDIEQIAKIITDDKTPREQLRAFKETGIVIEVAK
ncbi:Glucitol operon repressor [bioreactor metagenome]|uniref:Glucitol operon repressor n=1 Tax=bioreactor metagenome TaxID=1076179 RepID=A0A645EBC6_9ZZZZ